MPRREGLRSGAPTKGLRPTAGGAPPEREPRTSSGERASIAPLVDRSRALPPLLLALFGTIYAVIARVALRAFPFSGDEYSYFLQAELFARGMLRAPAPPHPELFRVDHVVLDAFIRSKYPPGTSALLALGVPSGLDWLVTPIEGVVTLVLVWVSARALLGARHALLTLLVMGISPLFALQAATYFSHTATTMWLAASFAALTAWSLSKRWPWLPLAGAFIGCAFLTRPVDAVMFAAALIVLRSWRPIALTAAGTVPFVLAHFAYQAAQYGSPFRDGYAAYEPTFRAIYGAETAEPPLSLLRIVNPLQQWFHVDICASFVGPWTLPGAVLLGVFGAAAIGAGHKAREMRNVAVAIVVVALVVLIPTVSSTGDDGPRPRYLSTSLLSVALLVGPGWDSARELLADRLGARTTRVIGIAAIAFAFVQTGAVTIERARAIEIRSGLYEVVRQMKIDEGIVLVRARWPTRYARNGPFFDRPILYLSAPPEMTPEDASRLYPGRKIYEAVEGSELWQVQRRL